MKLKNSYNKISMQEINKLSAILEAQLPKGYIDFLLVSNGGQPEEKSFIKRNTSGEIYINFEVNVFYGIGETDKSYDILTMFAINCDRIPEKLMPIGDDGVGNIICIGIVDDFYGKVYIWWNNDEYNEDEEPSVKNIELIENYFKDFLNGFI